MFYLINKPIWVSSFQAIAGLRKILNIKKVGHTGTLDPLATWLLLVATGNSTKLIPYFEKACKTYVFSFNIDWFTQTWDLWSEICYLEKNLVEKAKLEITKEKIIDLIKSQFFWKITQIPPKYSAIKIDWQRAYKLARDWKEINIPERSVEIFDYKLIEYNFPTISIEMTVSAWTYIRTIAEDIWKSLSLNAYTIKLHRSKIWNINESKSVKAENLSQNDSISYHELFPDFWEAIFNAENIEKILRWLALENSFWLEEWQKYFIKNKDWDYISLVEVRQNFVTVLINWIV